MKGGSKMNESVFVSIDGNNIGKRLERYILSERFDDLKSFSDRVSSAVSELSRFVVGLGGTVFMSGGDNLLATVPANERHFLKRFFDGVQSRDVSFAMGIGRNARASFLALKYAKAVEADCIVYEDTFPDASE